MLVRSDVPKHLRGGEVNDKLDSSVEDEELDALATVLLLRHVDADTGTA